LDPHKYYTIVTEEDIDEEEDKEISQEEKLQHMYKTEMIRKQFISEEWKPVHKWLYTLSDRHLHHDLHILIETYKNTLQPDIFQKIAKKITHTGILHVPSLLSEDFCTYLLEEIDAIERSGLPLTRPNSMNKYGVVLSEFGFDLLWQQLLNYIKPLLIYNYGNIVELLDSHHAFIVKYKTSEQKGLGFHYDDSELTLNICLGKTFTGGDLYFKGLYSQPQTHGEEYIYSHKKGETIFHYGEHRHGAHPITSGERLNLIIWYRASSLRQHTCQHNCPHHSHPKENNT